MEHEVLVRSSHGVSQNTYHLIWCTKYRYPVFRSAGMRKVCADFIQRAAKRHGIMIFEVRVMPDHMHVFVRAPRTMSVVRMIQLLKGHSAYWLRRYTDGLLRYRALWSRFSFSRTVGSVTGNVIEHYIRESNTKGRYGTQVSLSAF